MRPERLRICLKCNKSFDSKGPWNRICYECTRKNDKIYTVPIFIEEKDEPQTS